MSLDPPVESTPQLRADSPTPGLETIAAQRQISPLSGLMPEMSEHLGRRAAWLAVEGAFFTGIGLYVAHMLGVPQSGFIAIFLAAAGLTTRLNEVLDENRNRIRVRGGRSALWINLTSAFSVVMLFLGVFAAYTCAALWWGEDRLQGAFGFALQSANLGDDTLRTRNFSTADRLLIHNYLVLLTFFLLSFIYRAYGALLALCWNGCVWAMVLAMLGWRGLHTTVVSPVTFIVVSAVAVLPHLLIEAASYVLGSLAAIFLSRAATRYGVSDPRFVPVRRAVVKMLALAVIGIAVGAVVESTLPGALMPRL